MEKQEFVNKLYEKALKIDIKISEKELESQLPALLERKMKNYIEECFNNG